MPAATYSQAVLADTPLVWYRFTETSGVSAADSSGNNNSGTYRFAPTLNVTGPLVGQTSKAITVTGTNSCSGPTVPLRSYYGGRQTVSIECWAKFTNTSASAAIWGWSTSSVSSSSHNVYLINNSGVVSFVAATITVAGPAATDLDDGNWHHLVGVFAGDGVSAATVSLYVDGLLYHSTTANITGGKFPTSSADPIAAGAGGYLSNNPANANPASPFVGSVAEAAVYPQALTASRVLAHYQAGLEIVSTYSAAVLTDAPVAYYRLGEASGTVMVDSSGNARDGTYLAAFTLGQTGALTGDPNTAVAFAGNGADDGADAPAFLTGYPNSRTSLSLELWIKALDANQSGVAQTIAVGWGQSPNFNLGWDGSAFVPTVDFAGGGGLAPELTGVGDGAFHHIVLVWDKAGANTFTVYKDGVNVFSTGLATNTLPASGFAALTLNQDVSSLNFVGTLDEIAVYSQALFAARVLAHYNAGKAITTKAGSASRNFYSYGD